MTSPPRLFAVPAKPPRPRAYGYIRVSDVGDRGEQLISPELQETAIRDYCARRDYDLVGTVVDLNRTGTLWKRRAIEDSVRMVEAGDLDVVVVWKISRVARNTLDWAIAVDRVESAGGQIESATEPLDTSTSTGRFTRGMLAELAAFESARMGEEWKRVHQRRLDQGLPHHGPARLGYTYTHNAYVIDPVQAGIVRDLFARYNSGEGLGQLTAWLHAEGVTGARGGPWSRFGVSYYLRSGFPAGRLHIHDPACRCGKKGGACGNRIHIPGAHPPIIDEPTWQATQNTRVGRSTLPARSRVPVSRLAGVVICQGCGHPMQLQSSNTRTRYAFICRTNRNTLDNCPAPAWLKRTDAEDAARAWLQTIADDFDGQLADGPAEPVHAARIDRLHRRVLAADEALGNLAADLARRIIPESAFTRARTEIEQEQATAQAEINRLTGPDLTGMPAAARGLLELWDTAEPHETSALVRHLLRVKATRGELPVVVGAWTV